MTSAVDLTNCDREPIHILGSILPSGFLLTATADWMIARASANAPQWLGRTVDDLLGTSLIALLDPMAVHRIRNALASLRDQDAVDRAYAVPLFGDDRLFDLSVHVAGGEIVLECEPSEPPGETSSGSLIRTLIGRLQTTTDLKALCEEAARQLRVLTGFDRVMVYRFHPDGSGEVLVESKRASLESFLGLRYPASDIPVQARALYQRNWLRLIGDVDQDAVPILPQLNPRGEPLDLSMSALRSVSPIHREYLRNMGVAASMSVSIVHQGKLWGLFACHHATPRHIGFERRSIAELFGQMFSLLLGNREREAEMHYESEARRLHDQLMLAMAAEASAFDNVAKLAQEMTRLIPCDGVGVWVDGQATLRGVTPTEAEFQGLLRFLNRAAASSIYATDELGRLHPAATAYADRAAGLLAIPVSRTPRDYIVFFRREVTQSVTWAGNPAKPANPGPHGTRLTPRESFAAWVEVTHGRSNPWTEVELRVAESLRITLIEVILRLSDAAEQERRQAGERQALLIAELNHRVRNILALIRGLVAQGRGGAGTIEDFVQILGGRVQALARAHDQITTDRWGPAPLRTLIEAEAEAFLHVKAQAVVLDGPPVLLQPQAFTTMALVIHELMTNSAKYGALCDSRGSVSVRWSLDADRRLVLDWVERGGPAVQAPTRRGFGSMIIERAIPHELKGEARVDFDLAGLRARLVVPAALVVAGTAAERPAEPVPVATPARKLGHVLLVEDNMIIALDSEQMLLSLGASQVDVASNIADALAAIAVQPPSFALLDVNLGGETTFPVADRLRELGVPHVFATGYGADIAFPPQHAATPVVKKPYQAEDIAAVL